MLRLPVLLLAAATSFHPAPALPGTAAGADQDTAVISPAQHRASGTQAVAGVVSGGVTSVGIKDVTDDDCTVFGPQFIDEQRFAPALENLCLLVLRMASDARPRTATLIQAEEALTRYLVILEALSVRPVTTESDRVEIQAWRDVPPASKYLVARRLGLFDLATRLLPDRR